MPHSDLHVRRRQKNYAVAGVVVGFIALIFAVTILRM
jgi:hypothetical protein